MGTIATVGYESDFDDLGRCPARGADIEMMVIDQDRIEKIRNETVSRGLVGAYLISY